MQEDKFGAAKHILSDVFGIGIDSIQSDAGIENLREWDSLGHLRLITFIEKRIGKKIDTETMLNITSLKSLDDFLTHEG